MRFKEFFKRNNIENESQEINKRHDFENENKDPEIRAIDIQELGEIIHQKLAKESMIIEKALTEQENNKCLREIVSVYESFPKEIKELFRYKTHGIYYLPDLYKEWSGLTFQSREEYGKSAVLLNAKAVEIRDPSFVLIHELGHISDYETHPSEFTPKWAWDFIDKFEKEIMRKEPHPIEGSNRDKDNSFEDPREEWASRLAATIISLYLPDLPVTGLAVYPYTVEDFKKSYPKSFKFFKKYLKRLNQEIKAQANCKIIS